MNKPGFAWVTPVFCVSNLVKSLQYYANVLGLSISWRRSADDGFDVGAKPTFACANRGEWSLFLCENGQGNLGAWVFLNLGVLQDLDMYIKAFFPVISLSEARKKAAVFGGQLRPQNKQWQARGFRACEAVDPGGNVIQFRENLS